MRIAVLKSSEAYEIDEAINDRAAFCFPAICGPWAMF
jgi:hypothetical protein